MKYSVFSMFKISFCFHSQIKKKQDFIKQVLDTKKISYEEIDISLAMFEDERKFMREHAKARGTPNPLPPQIFIDQEYLGVSIYCCF